MVFREMLGEVESLLRFGGWFDTEPRPVLADLVNAAIREWSWEAEYYTGSETFSTVSGTAEYSLTTPPDWKLVKDCYYGDNTALRRTSEDEERRRDPMWMKNPDAVPECYWMPRPNTIRLYPTPSTGGTTITVHGVQADVDLSADTQVCGAPAHYHQYICYLAAALHAQRYAVGEGRAAVDRWQVEAYAKARDMQLSLASQVSHTLQRNVARRGTRIARIGQGAYSGSIKSV